MLLVLNKPYGMLSQFTQDCEGQVTLATCGFPPGVYPIGRLDLDSEGLLLLSDEAGLNTRLLDPKNAHPRTYHAQVEGEVTGEALSRLRGGGLVIQGHRTLPCMARRVEPAHPDRDPPIRYRAAIPTSWIELTLTEGKNRQVRRMTAAVGFPTLRLIRVAIGGLTIQVAQLAPGEWREITERERSQIVPKGGTSAPSRPRSDRPAVPAVDAPARAPCNSPHSAKPCRLATDAQSPPIQNSPRHRHRGECRLCRQHHDRP